MGLREQMQIQAFIFDFDGVLVDSERVHWRLYQEVLEPLGLGFTWEEYTAKWIALHDEGCMRAVAGERGKALSNAEFARLVAQKAEGFEAVLREGSFVFFPGVRELLAHLSTRIPVGIASGALRTEIEHILSANDLAAHFTTVVGAEDCRAHKPDPEPYARALAQLNEKRGTAIAPGACVVIEDTPAGIHAARAAGMHCLGITNSFGPEVLGEASAVIESLEGLTLEKIGTLLGG